MFEMMTGMINNIFFILFPIILYQTFAKPGKRNFLVNYRVTMTILFSISILLCMFFPYQFLSEDYIFDLRQVPMIVGALYGGPLISAVLFLVAAIGRILIGGDGMYVAVANQLLIAVCVPLLRPLYLRVKRYAKIIIVVFISVGSLLFNMVAGYFLFGDPIHDIVGIWIMLMINQSAVIVITALLIEHIVRQEYMYQSLLKHEKHESVSHFAASVSHELRNPIQSVKGFIQLMVAYDYSRDKQLEFHDIILKEIQSAENLIDDYLVYAKPEYGELQKISVPAEIRHITNVMTPFASGKDVTINMTDIPDNPHIKADRQKFHQALVNIIRNGVEAMPSGGELKIRISYQPSKVLIEISDEGVGMTPEEVRRLGEPYFSNKTKGTGLGMMVAYSVIRQMNGDILVKSEKGKGTTFTLVFPPAT